MNWRPVIAATATSFATFLLIGAFLVWHPWHLGPIFEYLETRRITK